MNNKIEIFKEPVLYMVVLRCRIIDNDDTFIHTTPVLMNTCDYPDSQDLNGDTIKLEKDDMVLGTVPAPIGMMQVSAGLPGRDSPVMLGYEYPGLEPKDWTEVAKDAIKLEYGGGK